MKKIYLDIDGVLLDKYQNPSQCLHEFIEYVTKNYDCYWATTHVVDGSTEGAIEYLKRNKVQEKTLELMKEIKGTSWDIIKTEALDMDSDFIWFEDMPSSGELEQLEKHNKRESLVWVDRKAGDGLCKWLNET